jgi:hypothetical protein
MTTTEEYERIGKFIYSACRYGADISDVHNWIADDLGIPRPTTDDQLALRELYTAFFAKHLSDDDFQANYGRFVEAMKSRAA